MLDKSLVEKPLLSTFKIEKDILDLYILFVRLFSLLFNNLKIEG